jgi:hypothetical protein
MKTRTMPIALLAIGFAVGCSHAPNPQEQCVQNMQMLWSVARSYQLDMNLSADQPIDPSTLTNYFRPQDMPFRCPLGTNTYAPFSYQAGPKCPNSDAHTAALLRSREGKTVQNQQVQPAPQDRRG